MSRQPSSTQRQQGSVELLFIALTAVFLVVLCLPLLRAVGTKTKSKVFDLCEEVSYTSYIDEHGERKYQYAIGTCGEDPVPPEGGDLGPIGGGRGG